MFLKLTSICLGVSLGFTSNISLSCSEDGREGFLPKNSVRIPVGAKFGSDMTEARFKEIMRDVLEIYRPVVEDTGNRLRIAGKWSSDTVNAFAYRSAYRNVWFVEMHGGLARHPEVTEDGMTSVICHELGHHLGGAPINTESSWSSAEGQSDYFATLKCLREVWKNDNNIKIVSELNTPDEVVKSCSEQFYSKEEIALCIRSSMAGLSTARLISSIRDTDPDKISFKTPDTSKVEKTNNNHPQPQCRLDTFYAGSLCEVSKDDTPDSEDPSIGSCSRSQGDKEGVRPLCWFKPN